MIVYLIELSGYSDKAKPYLQRAIGLYIETTSNPVFAKIWAKESSALQNAEKIEKKLSLSWPNIKATVRKAEFNLL